MKRIVLMCTFFIILLCGCATNGKTETSLEGIWMLEDGTRVVFTGNNEGKWGVLPITYSVFDKDKIKIHYMEDDWIYKIKISNEEMSFTDVDYGDVVKLYKNEKKQEQILKEKKERELAEVRELYGEDYGKYDSDFEKAIAMAQPWAAFDFSKQDYCWEDYGLIEINNQECYRIVLKGETETHTYYVSEFAVDLENDRLYEYDITTDSWFIIDFE